MGTPSGKYLLRDLGHQKVYVIMCGRGSGWGMMGMAYVTDAVRTYSDLTMCRTKYYLNEIILNSVIFSNYELGALLDSHDKLFICIILN